jgi:ABC-type glycerol-3-phosphate transport system permease component
VPIIPIVGRRQFSTRLVIAAIYAVLVIGAITMIYPFGLMLGTSLTTDYDFVDYRIIPRYLTHRGAFLVKYLCEKYGADNFNEFRAKYRSPSLRFQTVTDVQPVDVEAPQVKRRVRDWQEFLGELPAEYWTVYWIDAALLGIAQERYQRYLRERFNDDIDAYNAYFDASTTVFDVIAPVLRIGYRHDQPPRNLEGDSGYVRQLRAWEGFRETLPVRFRRDFPIEPLWHDFIRSVTREVAFYNRVFDASLSGIEWARFPLKRPDAGRARDLWDEFLRTKYPLRFMEIEGGEDLWPGFLSERHGSIEVLNTLYKADYSDFGSVPMPHSAPANEAQFLDWKDFVDRVLPAEQKRPTSVVKMYANWLRRQYSDLNALNRAHGSAWRSRDEIWPPYREADQLDVAERHGSILWRFLTHNYTVVWRYIAQRDYALWNTFVLVVGTITTQLTIMPLAAFALSRFNLPYAYRILLFLLATMAFPAEVAMIPNFLLLRELHLLNTYWALILPGVANGFGIFLLKGFFDSLPKELYEAAMIEGASELHMFWNITIRLSLPILAVIGIFSFQAAYGGFMWAFLICQKREMWTLMVYLYELPHEVPAFISVAGYVLAGIPTLLVFVFCQRIILRGIIVPQFK